jgi:DNA-binding MarR family transcriptional regulator
MSTSDEGEVDAPPGTWEAVRELPPSAKLVAKALEYHGTLTQSELAEETMLPARTVRYAISRLEEVEAIESTFSFTDARKRLYSLSVESEPSPTRATSNA